VVFGQKASFLPRPPVAAAVTVDRGGAGGWMQGSEENFDESGFAGAIGAEEAENFTLGDFKADISKRLDIVLSAQASAEGFGEMFDSYGNGGVSHNQSNDPSSKKLHQSTNRRADGEYLPFSGKPIQALSLPDL
jgi:hypothetical protein